MRKIPAPYTDPTPLFRHGGAPRTGMLDFSASINPLGPPESVLRVLRRELPSITHYPDPECRALTERLAKEHQVEPNQIVVGNGSNELIYAIARAFRPKRVAIAEPTYTEYLRASLLVGATVDHWVAEDDDFQLQAFPPDGADVVWLCEPNSPTGGLWADDLERWITTHPSTVFVVDEAFLPLVYKKFYSSDPSFLADTRVPRIASAPNLIVLRSLTKVFALPGLRLGYLVARPEFAASVRTQIPPWSVNVLAQQAGLAALDDNEFADRTHDWIGEVVGAFGDDTLVFEDALQASSDRLHPLRTVANFALVRVDGLSSTELVERLAGRGIAVRDASNFVGLDDRYVRISMRTAAENRLLCAELTSVLQG
ncbi:MAG: pyridoxal phosphate-dependent class II aminotransferase [Gemmataceae bacterium]|nr:pyridoxal phosphate-dependent class II aminotransferase [Gemmataceae bacterium]